MPRLCLAISWISRLSVISKESSRRKISLWAWIKRNYCSYSSQRSRAGLTNGDTPSYERVVVHILESQYEKRFGLARRILNLVISAERPLRWKEIQSHFSIDVQSETANPKSRLLKPGKKYCGSLIEISRKDERGPGDSGPDDVLELVHETART